MKIFDDIWDSIKGNAKSRINDPIFGAFVFSWCLCNWDKLVILFFGNLTLEDRVSKISEQFDVFESPSLLYSNPDFLILPIFISAFYLYCLPNLSHQLKKILHPIEIKQHDQAVDLDIEKANKQLDLNKARLVANPEKDFLVKKVQIDLDNEQELLTQNIQRTILFKEKVARAKSKAEEGKSEADKVKYEAVDAKKKSELKAIELEKKNKISKLEEFRFEQSKAEHKATLASNRFPSAYFLLNELSEYLKEDELTLSLNGLSSCIAALFGYENFEALLNDKNFNNEGLQNIKYIYLNYTALQTRLEIIVEDEDSDNKDLTGDVLYEHLSQMSELLSYDLSDEEAIADRVYQLICDDGAHDLLNEESLSGPMTDANTLYDEGVDDIQLVKFEFNENTGLTVELTASASGSHYKESDVPGIPLDIKFTAICSPLLGKFGLKQFEIVDVQGSLDNYWGED